jgi:hypothetical protein
MNIFLFNTVQEVNGKSSLHLITHSVIDNWDSGCITPNTVFTKIRFQTAQVLVSFHMTSGSNLGSETMSEFSWFSADPPDYLKQELEYLSQHRNYTMN